MSLGAVFNLVLRDERFDKFFTASDYLRQRLGEIRKKKTQLGESNVQPTFADIERTHMLHIHSVYRPYVSVASEYTRVKASGDGNSSLGASGGTLQFTFPIYGHFTSDIAIHVRFKSLGSINTTTASADTPYYKYCALPGVRMFKKVELRSAQVLIDDYTPDDVMAHHRFFTRRDHKVAWERCMGQQDKREATYYANGFTGSFSYRDGHQTPKLYQEELEMYIPLHFWFCKDASGALLNDLIPNTQRTITCELAPLSDIIQAVLPDPFNNNIMTPVTLPISSVALEVDLYVNGLYVNPEVHDIFASRVGFSMIHVHRRQTNQLQSASDSFLLDQLKFPAEFLMVGFRSRLLAKDFDRWWMMGVPKKRNKFNRLMLPAVIWNPTDNIHEFLIREATEVTSLESIISTIGVTAHGIEIFPHLPSQFYNTYTPIRYAENSMVVSPSDTSAFLINFCLYPGKATPSGYYNLSAGREMYINYTLKTDEIAGGDHEMVLTMSALNFLVRRGDKISLRYAL